jgi:hypothetical protein
MATGQATNTNSAHAQRASMFAAIVVSGGMFASRTRKL